MQLFSMPRGFKVSVKRIYVEQMKMLHSDWLNSCGTQRRNELFPNVKESFLAKI